MGANTRASDQLKQRTRTRVQQKRLGRFKRNATRDWGPMKKFLLGTVAVVAFAAPAAAADLAARPYTKVLPMIAAGYDWSGLAPTVAGVRAATAGMR